MRTSCPPLPFFLSAPLTLSVLSRPTPHSSTPFTDYLIGYNRAAWERYVHHPFPNGLADGTMPLDSFLHFIQQDYHFLKVGIHLARTLRCGGTNREGADHHKLTAVSLSLRTGTM